MTEYREGDDVIPVRLRSVAADRDDIDKLYGLSVYSGSRGTVVPLTQVADVDLSFEPGVIRRRDRVRTLSLNVQIRPGATATDVNAVLVPWLDSVQASWPSGYGYELGGEAEESGDANASIAEKLPLGLMVIVLLLVGQFNSIRRPIIILATIPLGLIGVTFGLLVAGSSFGFFTILGIISLAGIIINNAIVLLDRIRIERVELETTAGRSGHQCVPATLPSHPIDDRHNRPGHAAAVVGRRRDVSADGDLHHLRPRVRDRADAGRGAGALRDFVSGTVYVTDGVRATATTQLTYALWDGRCFFECSHG